ncbi:thioesterase [Alkalibacterium pelagium]|nr:thioesterase [Alkalibacterium pelagium]
MWLIAGIVLAIAAGLVFIRIRTYQAMPEAVTLLDESHVTVEEDWIRVDSDSNRGNIVLYQGGLVEPEAYLPLADQLSEIGYRVFIPYMPINLAILGSDKIDDILEMYEDEEKWWLGGHSLGGTSASIYASDEHDKINGLFFLAAYPNDGSDLSDLEIPVLSITGTQDEILNRESYESASSNLPVGTEFYQIEGGNHSNFGYYGFQNGDGESLISREEQHEEVAEKLDDFIQRHQ